MVNLFMCTSAGNVISDRSIKRYKNIFSRSLSTTTSSALDIRGYLPEGVDYTKLTVDNFVIDALTLENPTQIYTETSNITETYAGAVYTSSADLVKFSQYDNITGKLTLVIVPPSLLIVGNNSQDVYGMKNKNSAKMKVNFSVGLIV